MSSLFIVNIIFTVSCVIAVIIITRVCLKKYLAAFLGSTKPNAKKDKETELIKCFINDYEDEEG